MNSYISTGSFTPGSRSTPLDTSTPYGRTSRTEVANGQSSSGYYQTATCYDGNGNAAFKSYAYQGAGFSASKVCSGSGDTYTYDVLGRVTSVVRANNESRSITYLGRAKRYIDENNVTRISQVDGLGRTTIVCEISSNALAGVSPTSCGTDIAGTGDYRGAVFACQGIFYSVAARDDSGAKNEITHFPKPFDPAF